MTYRAPVADIAFTLKHAAGFGARAWRRALRRPHRRRRRRRARGSRPVRDRGDRAAQPRRRPAWRRAQGRRGHDAAGLEGGLSRLGRSRLERARRAGGMGGQGLPHAVNVGLHRDVELGRDGLRARPAADDGRDRGARRARLATSCKRAYLPKLVVRRMDRHDEPDRAAGRLRPRRAAHARPSAPATAPTASPARRSSSPMASTT